MRYQQLAHAVIKEADILLMVLDARQADVTVNDLLLNMIGDKKLIYVINKIDLVPEEQWKSLKQRFKPSIAVSCTKHQGTIMLLKKINQIAHGEEVKVGVLGYPNTGKSSLINALRSRGATSVSPVAGHTKALQNVRVSSTVLLIDTPGVLPFADIYNEEKREKLSFIGTTDIHKVKEPDLLAMKLMQAYPGIVESHYAVAVLDDYELTLETIAAKKHYFLAGKEPDSKRMAKQILEDFQRGKINHV